MDKYRRVEIRHLDTFRIMLNQLKHDDGKKLLDYYDKYILQEKQAEINSLKRVLYSLMTTYRSIGNEEVSKKYYLLYQELKNRKVTVEEALKLYEEIIEQTK